jgi:hypothetical protein
VKAVKLDYQIGCLLSKYTWLYYYMHCLDLSSIRLLLEVIQQHRKSTSLLSKVGNDSTGGTDGLLDTAIVIELGKSTPGTKVLSSFDHDNVDFTFGTKTLDELLVFLILTILGQATKASRSAIQSLGTLVKTLLESTVDHCLFKDLL